MEIGRELYQSLVQKYESEIQESKTTLMIFFEQSVGIGDHSNHIEEMDEIVAKMSSSHDKLMMLKLVFENTYSKL
tara:strand:- start:1270 stop:1494 length:225 start_codon:yes stop_codon:yes gene_type:complete